MILWMMFGEIGTAKRSWQCVSTMLPPITIHYSLLIEYLGKTLFKKHDTVLIEWAKQSEQFKLFPECFKLDDVEKWEASVRQWECDPSKPNPYIIKLSCVLFPLYLIFSQYF
jgi:hypothetical protein